MVKIGILLDWGYDRGKIHCERCGDYMHDIDEALKRDSNGSRIAVKDLLNKVPVICRGCNFPRIADKEEWIDACKKFDERLLAIYGEE